MEVVLVEEIATVILEDSPVVVDLVSSIKQKVPPVLPSLMILTPEC